MRKQSWCKKDYIYILLFGPFLILLVLIETWDQQLALAYEKNKWTSWLNHHLACWFSFVKCLFMYIKKIVF